MTAQGARVEIKEHTLEAFHKLKEAILSEPVLWHPDYSRLFVLKTDASGIAAAAILEQLDDNSKPYAVGYGSKKFTTTQQNWDTREREAYAALWGCEFFRHFLLGSPFELQTDHESLQWLNSPANTGKIARWAIRLSEFMYSTPLFALAKCRPVWMLCHDWRMHLKAIWMSPLMCQPMAMSTQEVTFVHLKSVTTMN